MFGLSPMKAKRPSTARVLGAVVVEASEADALDPAIAQHRFDHGVPAEAEAVVVGGSADIATPGPEPACAMDQRDLAGDAGEVQGLLEGGITAADHGDGAVAKEGGIAEGALGDAPARELLLTGHAEPFQPGAGSDDQLVRLEGAVVGQEALAIAVEFDGRHGPRDEDDAERAARLDQGMRQLCAGERCGCGIAVEHADVGDETAKELGLEAGHPDPVERQMMGRRRVW